MPAPPKPNAWLPPAAVLASIPAPTYINRATGCPVVVPITSGGGFARRAGFAVALEGTATTGIVRCDQPRALDLAARHGRRVEMAPGAIVSEVLARLAPLFEQQ